MSYKYEKMNLFEQLRAGLEESIAFSKGQLSLKTTIVPAPPPRIGAEQVAALRRRLKMSQAVFAATLNVSTKTVQSWEQGAREPSDAALRIIQLVREEPGVVTRLFGGLCRSTSDTPSKRRGVLARRTRRTGNGTVAKR